jgi:serine/threonine-protein phosphatase 5
MSSEGNVSVGERHQVSDATKARAEELKTEGNAALAQFKFAAAVELYSKAIELFPTAIYYANRAAAHMKTESYGLAIDDASAAIEAEPSYIKGALCLGCSFVKVEGSVCERVV